MFVTEVMLTDWKTNRLMDWQTDKWTDRWAEGLLVWLTDCLSVCLSDWLTDCLDRDRQTDRQTDWWIDGGKMTIRLPFMKRQSQIAALQQINAGFQISFQDRGVSTRNSWPAGQIALFPPNRYKFSFSLSGHVADFVGFWPESSHLQYIGNTLNGDTT